MKTEEIANVSATVKTMFNSWPKETRKTVVYLFEIDMLFFFTQIQGLDGLPAPFPVYLPSCVYSGCTFLNIISLQSAAGTDNEIS